MFLTKEEHDKCIQDSDEIKLEDEYYRGYQNAMVDFQIQMNLRNRAVQISNIPKKNTIEQASTNKTHNAKIDKDTNDNEKLQEEVVRKEHIKENFYEELLQKEVPNKEALEKNDPSGDIGNKQLVNLKELNS